MIPSELVSVVITTYNRSDALLAVLDGLSRQTDRVFEVIVADDGSSKDHQSLIFESHFAKVLRVIHVWHPDIGFTAARVRNRGVSASNGNYIIFLDGDCVPEIDFIAQHKAFARQGFYVNGSRVLLSPDFTKKVVNGSGNICGRSMMFWLLQRFQGHANKLTGLLRFPDSSWRVQRKFSWKGIRSCNMAVWRKDFELVDGFDESFVGWGHEDADFVLRLHNAGVLRINGFCATEVFHLWHRDAARDKESKNAMVVLTRSKSGATLSEMGFAQKRINDDVVITRLG